MDATKEVIADAVRQYCVTESDQWTRQFKGCEAAQIEATPLDFHTHDVLFDGTAKIHVLRSNKAEDIVTAHVYGRSDGRRAIVDAVVFDIA